MIAQLDELWWVPLITVPIFAIMIWTLKKRLSTIKPFNIKNQLTTLGILLFMAVSMFPSAAGTDNHIPKLSRVLLGFNILCIIALSWNIIRNQRNKRKAPNQAL